MSQLLNWLQALDSRGFLFINHNLQNSFFDIVMPFFSHLGTGGFVWLFIAFIAAVFGRGAGRKMAFLALLALLVSWFLSEEIIKGLVARPRPFLNFPAARILADKPLSFSFPSGHTNISFASAVTFLRKNRRVGVPALLLAALIGFSRVYVGAHYPLDVIGGALLGGTVGWSVVYSEGYIDKLIIRYKSFMAKYSHKNRMKEKD